MANDFDRNFINIIIDLAQEVGEDTVNIMMELPSVEQRGYVLGQALVQNHQLLATLFIGMAAYMYETGQIGDVEYQELLDSADHIDKHGVDGVEDTYSIMEKFDVN